MQTKARSALQAIAANRLSDGAAVWLGPGNEWVERVEDAATFAADAIAAALETARAAERAQIVVDSYAIDVELRAGRPSPRHVRERIKALGPSVRPDLGKQAGASPHADAA